MNEQAKDRPRGLVGREAKHDIAADPRVRFVVGHLLRDELPLRTKDDVLKEKKVLMGQLTTLARDQLVLKKEILEGNMPDNEDEYGRYASEESLQAKGINSENMLLARFVLDRARGRRKTIRQWIGNKSGKEAYAVLPLPEMGHEPEGEVELIDRGLCFELKCHDIRDFRRMTSETAGATTFNLFTEPEQGIHSPYVPGGYIVTCEEASNLPVNEETRETFGPDGPTYESLLAHELQHAWHDFLNLAMLNEERRDTHLATSDVAFTKAIEERPIAPFEPFPEPEDDIRSKALQRFIEDRTGLFLRTRCAGEILAHSHHEDMAPWNGQTPGPIVQQRASHYFSDYYKEWTSSLVYKRTLSQMPPAQARWVRHEMVRLYRRVRVEGLRALEAVQTLRQLGIPKEEVAALLTLEPLYRWPKVAKRFKEAFEADKKSE